MVRYLFAIPHYFAGRGSARRHGSQSGDRAWRSRALRETILCLRRTLSTSQCMMQLDRRESEAANGALRGEVKIVVCTAGDDHLLPETNLSPGLYEHVSCTTPPPLLGYACHEILLQRRAEAEWFGYLEDDLLLRDSLLFQKLEWFLQLAGDDALLLPNRYEVASTFPILRAYIDGDLRDDVTRRWQDRSDRPEYRAKVVGSQIRLQRPANPHAGCFFLRRDQLDRWASLPFFLDRSDAFIGPLESAATLGIMRAFRIYKPALEYAGFFEVEHQSNQFIKQLRPRSK